MSVFQSPTVAKKSSNFFYVLGLLKHVGLKSFSRSLFNIWNALPDSIVKAPSVNSFKSKINSLHFCDFFVLIVLFDYIFNLFFFWGGGMLVQALGPGYTVCLVFFLFFLCLYFLTSCLCFVIWCT